MITAAIDISAPVKKGSVDISGVQVVISADLKKEEQAVLNFCSLNNIEFIIYSDEEPMIMGRELNKKHTVMVCS